MRLTIPTCLVLCGLAEIADDRKRYGRALVGHTGLESGTVHPILRRLEAHGAVIAVPEVGNPVELRRPLRTCYRLTPAGHDLVTRAAARLSRLA